MDQLFMNNNNMAVKQPPIQVENAGQTFVPKVEPPSPEKPKMPSTPEYLGQLLGDQKNINKIMPNIFIHAGRLLEEEINRVRKSLYSLGTSKDTKPLNLPEERGPKVTLQEKLFVPIKAYPTFNFVGRILGPRGMTAKKFEEDTKCKIMIRGKGSMKDKKKEEQNRGKPNWEHLNEDLHVLITVEDTEERAKAKLARAAEEMKKLLIPTADGEDELKKKQLMDLALLNGTYRDPTARPQTTLTAAPLVSPRTVPPPGPALVPQPLRSPTPAAQAHLLAAPFLPRVSGLANGFNGFTGALPGQATIPTPDGSGGFIYHAYDPYQFASFAPTMLEYPGGATDGTIGPAKMRRAQVREHPYQRAMIDARGDNLLAMMQENALKQRAQEVKVPTSIPTAWFPHV